MAVSTMKIRAEMCEKFKTTVNASHTFIIDQPAAAGGTDEGANPLEYFLSSLAGCICAIGRIIANQKRLPVRSICADISGEIDKDYLLGKTKEGRAGFTAIKADVTIDADMSEQEKKVFLEEIDERCPVSDNMQRGTSVSFNLK